MTMQYSFGVTVEQLSHESLLQRLLFELLINAFVSESIAMATPIAWHHSCFEYSSKS